ncbi:MAG: hypothetical protein ACYC8T_10055, partial [Myxococcaceae bacterium]
MLDPSLDGAQLAKGLDQVGAGGGAAFTEAGQLAAPGVGSRVVPQGISRAVSPAEASDFPESAPWGSFR